MKKNSVLLLIIVIISALMIGQVVANLSVNSKYFSWLAISQSFGISTDSPLMLDLGIIKLKLGIMINITISSILCLLISLILFRKLK